MHYVDVNIFLEARLYETPQADRASAFLTKIASGEIRAVTSVLTWDELVWVMRKLFGSSQAREEGQRFLRFPNLRLLVIDALIVQGAQRIMEAYDMRPRDAIHLASALAIKADDLVTFDTDFKNVKELKIIAP